MTRQTCECCRRPMYSGPIDAYTKDYCWHTGNEACLRLVIDRAIRKMDDGEPHDAYLALETARGALGS